MKTITTTDQYMVLHGSVNGKEGWYAVGGRMRGPYATEKAAEQNGLRTIALQQAADLIEDIDPADNLTQPMTEAEEEAELNRLAQKWAADTKTVEAHLKKRLGKKTE